MLLSFVGFSTFRGIMDVKTSVKIALLSNIVTAVLDPILIHVLGFGARGAAIASVSGETVSAILNMKLLLDRNLIQWKKLVKLPSWTSVAPLLRGGAALQVRSVVLNLTGLMVARVIQSLDDRGVAPAAHAIVMQTFQLGNVILGALGMATQTLVPNAMAKRHEDGGNLVEGVPYAKALVMRLFNWGLKLGFGVGLLQLLFLPMILKSSPLLEVREVARVPTLIAISFQAINAIVNVGEGVMMGSGSFTWLSINIVFAAVGYVGALQIFPQNFGLTGVWISLATFTLIRLAGVLVHLSLKSPWENKSEHMH
jgi:Na+-driven multidrug efflux pump